MADFTAYLVGCGDEGFDFNDPRWNTAGDLQEWLAAHANRPCWVRLGRLSVFSQNIIAIEQEVVS